MSRGNHDQTAYWNGEVGQRWAGSQAVLDAIFAPLTQALFDAAALVPGERLLDVGCGAGQTSLSAAARLGPAGRVTGADLSAPLLAVARARAADDGAGGAPIDWVEADAQDHEFGAACYDHVLSRFGVMFFSDSVAAFANLRRSLRRGGRLTVLCWRGIAENPWAGIPRAAALGVLPDPEPPVPPDGPGPFRFARAEAVRDVLQAAGFADVACAPVDRPVTLGLGATDEAALAAAVGFAVELGPVARLLREHPAPLREAARAAVAQALGSHVRDGRVRLEAGCWCVTARA